VVPRDFAQKGHPQLRSWIGDSVTPPAREAAAPLVCCRGRDYPVYSNRETGESVSETLERGDYRSASLAGAGMRSAFGRRPPRRQRQRDQQPFFVRGCRALNPASHFRLLVRDLVLGDLAEGS